MNGIFSNISERQRVDIHLPSVKSSDEWKEVHSLPELSVEHTSSAEKKLQELFSYYIASHVSQIDSLGQLKRWLELKTNLTGRVRFLDFPQENLFVGGVSTIDTTMLDQIGRLYNMHNHEEVLKFLKKNVFLIDILLDAFPKLQKYFGANVKVDLVLRTDPEELYQELFGYIKASQSIDESHASLEEFDDYWFLDHLDATRGLLNFNLIFS